MMFSETIGIAFEENKKVYQRVAVRAIILKGNKILLIHTNKGDYISPGGGVKALESFTQALLREIAEESGYKNCQEIDKIGIVEENQVDNYDQNAYFQMVSHYYLCTGGYRHARAEIRYI